MKVSTTSLLLHWATGACKDVKGSSLLDDIIAKVEYLNFWICINPNYDCGHFQGHYHPPRWNARRIVRIPWNEGKSSVHLLYHKHLAFTWQFDCHCGNSNIIRLWVMETNSFSCTAQLIQFLNKDETVWSSKL